MISTLDQWLQIQATAQLTILFVMTPQRDSGCRLLCCQPETVPSTPLYIQATCILRLLHVDLSSCEVFFIALNYGYMLLCPTGSQFVGLPIAGAYWRTNPWAFYAWFMQSSGTIYWIIPNTGSAGTAITAEKVRQFDYSSSPLLICEAFVAFDSCPGSWSKTWRD